MQRFLPSSGRYMLNKHFPVYLWFKKCEREKKHPYWELLKLIKNNNSTDLLEIETVEQVEEITEYHREEETEGVHTISNGQNDDEKAFFCCMCSKDICAKEFLKHVDDCEKKDPESLYHCINCDLVLESNDALYDHMLECE